VGLIFTELSLRKGDPFAVVQNDATNYSIFKEYFDLIELILTENWLKYSLSQIYNCDESGMPLQHKTPKVVAVKGRSTK